MAALLAFLGAAVSASVYAETRQEDAWTSFGEAIFFDTALSADKRTSCASCHRPELAFTDGRTTSVGVFERIGSRNAPSLIDVDALTSFFWEGRIGTLDAALTEAFFNPHEMGLENAEDLLERVAASSGYDAFVTTRGEAMSDPDLATVARALEAFLTSQPRHTSPFDRYLAGDKGALTDQERRGLGVFTGKARCSECHQIDPKPALLTDHLFHHTGVGFDGIATHLPELMRQYRESLDTAPPGATIIGEPDISELGRYLATGRTADLGAFRTPSLRNVARTAPYMHNGSVATLPEALDREVYYRSIVSGQPISLTLQERADLLAFLESLSDEDVR